MDKNLHMKWKINIDKQYTGSYVRCIYFKYCNQRAKGCVFSVNMEKGTCKNNAFLKWMIFKNGEK
jgi:hypothetical protein